MRKLGVVFMLLSIAGFGQDSTRLSLESMLKMTLSYHPIVKQAGLINSDAEARLREAKGQFDPKLAMDYNLKDFKEIEYYNLLNTSLKVPTWIGIDPKLEFYKYTGEYVGDELFISDATNNEQVALGVSIPVGKGLFFDERRNAVRQAEAFTDIAEAEQIKQTNKILFIVIKDYWSWYYAYKRVELLSQAVVLAQNLFDRTLIDYQYGEAAVVDTLQAKINFQKRAVDYRKSLLDYELAKLNLSKHLWSENLVPLELGENTLPDSTSLFFGLRDQDMKANIDNALSNHPEIVKLQGKRNQLDANLRWNKESLKPQVDLSYSLIDAPVNPDFRSSTVDWGENYKLGVDFSIPILLRKERGKLQQTRLKLQSNEFEMAQQQIALRNEMIGQFTQSLAFEDLLFQYQDVATNYQLLLDAELINLQNGETDIFKLNIQQDKFIEAKSEFYEVFAKWEKSKAEYYYATGQPFLGLANVFGIATN